jgi:L-rhamnose-H+ transport protein
MNMTIIFGIILIGTGAFMSGSFSIPFDKVKNWKWENYWLVYGFFAYIIMPLLACLIFSPDFLSVYQLLPASKLIWIFFLGAIYGIANLTFGLSLRYLGVALGYALSLGLMMAIGTVVPPILDGRLAKMFEGAGGILLLSGIAVSLVGIVISGYAGMLKNKQLEALKLAAVNKDFHLGKGLIAALFVGITGSSMALGIEQGGFITKSIIANGTNPLFADSALFLLLYSGSFVTTLIWCLYQSKKGGSLSNFIKPNNNSLIKNYIYCGLAGFLWYINYVFFGMGKSSMGEFSFVAWGILMSLTIVFATLWGLYRGEWRGVNKHIKLLMWIGLATLIFASFLIGLSSN